MTLAKSSGTSRSPSSLSSILVALAATSLVAVSVTGCGLLKKGGDDAGADDAAAAVAVADAQVAEAAAPEPVATGALVGVNQNDVARFPDETALANVPAVLQRPTNVREIPSVGKVVSALAKGVTVTQTAQRGTAFLVVFDDAKDGQKRMGWVGAEAFSAAPAIDAGVAPPKCTTPDVALRGDVDFCGRVCAADSACPAGQACKGEAKIFTNGKPGDQVRVCTVFTPPGAGATQVNPTRPGLNLLDASAPAALPAQATDVALAQAKEPKCAPNATFSAKDGQCHKNCAVVNAPCTGANKCQTCQGKNVCGAPNFCK